MDLNAIKAGTLCIPGTLPKVLDDASDLVGLESPRRDIGPKRPEQHHATCGQQRTRCHWSRSVVELGVGHPTAVPELEEYPALCTVDRFSHCLPA